MELKSSEPAITVFVGSILLLDPKTANVDETVWLGVFSTLDGVKKAAAEYFADSGEETPVCLEFLNVVEEIVDQGHSKRHIFDQELQPAELPMSDCSLKFREWCNKQRAKNGLPPIVE